MLDKKRSEKLKKIKKWWKDIKSDPQKLAALKEKRRQTQNHLFATNKLSFWMNDKKLFASYKGSSFKPFSYWAKKMNNDNFHRFVNRKFNWGIWQIKEFQLV